MFQSSNPALASDDAFQQFYGDRLAARPTTVTLQGVVNKTAILIALAIGAGVFGYWLMGRLPGTPVVMMSALASMAVCFGAFFIMRGNPAHARILAPIYALTEGVFLGSFSAALDGWLARSGLGMAGGVALQALIITVSIMIVMLVLYSTGLLKPTKLFVSIVSVATVGIMLTYLISWPVSLLMGRDLPLIGLSSAFGNGWTPIIGLGINVLILGVASMWLIIDFKLIEDHIKAGADRRMEWYCGFALLVTLAWIYYEAVKLAFRIAVLLGSRD